MMMGRAASPLPLVAFGGLLLVLVLVLALFLPHPATAAEVVSSSGEVCPGEGIAQRFVPCVANFIADKADEFFEKVTPILQTAISATLLLSVIFFGVQLAAGNVQKAAKETFILLLKYGAVIFFTSNLSMIFHWSLDILNGLIDIVSSVDYSSGSLKCQATGGSGGGGMGGGGGSAGSGATNSVWERMDCLLDMLIGIKSGSSSGAGGSSDLARGLLSFLFKAGSSGALGVMVTILGSYMIFNITMGLFRAIMTYLIGLMMLVLVVLCGLMFIPLVLFKATGTVYFRKWTKMIGSMILQPVIVFAFLNVVITAVDVMIYSGQSSVYRTIAGNAVDQKDFAMGKYIDESGRTARNKFVPGAVDLSSNANGEQPGKSEQVYGSFAGNSPTAKKDPNLNDPGTVGIGLEYETIDYEKLKQTRQGGPPLPKGENDKQSMMWGVASAVLLAALVSFLLIQLMNYMPRLAQDLGGGIKETPDIGTLGAQLPFQKSLSRGVGNVTGQMQDLLAKRPGAGG